MEQHSHTAEGFASDVSSPVPPLRPWWEELALWLCQEEYRRKVNSIKQWKENPDGGMEPKWTSQRQVIIQQIGEKAAGRKLPEEKDLNLFLWGITKPEVKRLHDLRIKAPSIAKLVQDKFEIILSTINLSRKIKDGFFDDDSSGGVPMVSERPHRTSSLKPSENNEGSQHTFAMNSPSPPVPPSDFHNDNFSNAIQAPNPTSDSANFDLGNLNFGFGEKDKSHPAILEEKQPGYPHSALTGTVAQLPASISQILSTTSNTSRFPTNEDHATASWNVSKQASLSTPGENITNYSLTMEKFERMEHKVKFMREKIKSLERGKEDESQWRQTVDRDIRAFESQFQELALLLYEAPEAFWEKWFIVNGIFKELRSSVASRNSIDSGIGSISTQRGSSSHKSEFIESLRTDQDNKKRKQASPAQREHLGSPMYDPHYNSHNSTNRNENPRARNNAPQGHAIAYGIASSQMVGQPPMTSNYAPQQLQSQSLYRAAGFPNAPPPNFDQSQGRDTFDHRLPMHPKQIDSPSLTSRALDISQNRNNIEFELPRRPSNSSLRYVRPGTPLQGQHSPYSQYYRVLPMHMSANTNGPRLGHPGNGQQGSYASSPAQLQQSQSGMAPPNPTNMIPLLQAQYGNHATYPQYSR